MAYLQHGGFLFLISLLLQNEKEESRNEWKGMKIITNNLLLHKTCCAFMMHKSCFAWFPLPDGLHTCIQKWYRNETEMIRWKKMIHKMNYMHPPTFGVFWLLIFSSCKTKHSIVHKKSYKFCWWSLIWCNKPL